MKCLLIRQPYASLIAYGCKRWEFRSYNCSYQGKVGIASSRGRPFKTGDDNLNEHAKSFPRGFVLATGELVRSFPASSNDLRKNYKGQVKIKIHGFSVTVAKGPLGEPINDIQMALDNEEWKSFVWEFADIVPFSSPVQINAKSNGVWIDIEVKETGNRGRKDLMSYL